jgi:biotin carboxyl carrier protein
MLAVRATLAPGAGLADVPPLVLEPTTDPEGRHRDLVNGAPTEAELLVRDRERAVLVGGVGGSAGAASERVLLLPPAPAPGTARGVVRREVVVGGWRVEVDVESAARAALRDRARRGRAETGLSGPTEVRAIIPGVVVSVFVAPGQVVVAGEHLLVVEAMKMQNELRAPRDGTIEQVAVGAGATIEAGDLLLVIA